METQTVEFNIEDAEIGQRLDKIVTDHLASLSRVKVQQLIKEGHVVVDGQPGKASYRVEAGDAIAVRVVADIFTPDWAAATPAERLPLDVLYEDDDMAAINKPADCNCLYDAFLPD